MWQIIKNKIERTDWSVWCFGFIGWITIALTITLLLLFSFSEKRIKGYYLQSTNTSAGISYQIWVNIEWCADTVAFLSSDPALTMETFKQLQQCPSIK